MGRLKGYSSVVIEHIRSESKYYVSIVVGTVIALGWFNTQFLTNAQAKLTHEQMIQQRQDADKELSNGLEKTNDSIKELKELVTIQMQKQSLSDVRQAITTNESEMFQLQRLIETDSPRPQDIKRLQVLKAERADLDLRRQCIITKNNVCD